MFLYNAFVAQYGTTVLNVENLSAPINPEIGHEVHSGSLHPHFAVMRGQKPAINFRSHAITQLLAETGYLGVKIDDSNLFTGFFAQMDGLLPDTDPVHRSYELDRGWLFARSLSVAHQQDAVLDVTALAYSSDGETEPFVISDTATLPTVPRDNKRFTLGPVEIAGVDMGCVTNVSMDFGNQVRTRGCLSRLWDEHLENPGMQSVLTITGIDPTKFADSGIPMKGKAGVHADSVIYLRKYDESGIDFVADTLSPSDEEHVKIDVEGIATVTEHSGSGNETSELTVQFHCTIDDSGNAPVAIDTASAIT